MTEPRNRRSLSDFQRNAKEHIDRIRETGQPEVLTSKGEAVAVVHDIDSYRKLLEQLELAESLAGLKRGIAEANRNEGRPLRDALRDLASRKNVELDG